MFTTALFAPCIESQTMKWKALGGLGAFMINDIVYAERFPSRSNYETYHLRGSVVPKKHHHLIHSIQLTLSTQGTRPRILTTIMPSRFSSFLEEAKQGGKDLRAEEKKEEETPQPANSPAEQVPAEQGRTEPVPAELLASVGKIMNKLNKTPIDINGSPNPSGHPVLYLPRTSYVKRVPGVPYAVSDVNHTCSTCKPGRACDWHREVVNTCNYCIRAIPCERHLPQKTQRTSLALCDMNHHRMSMYWDITDPDNRKGTWSLAYQNNRDEYVNKIVVHECPRMGTIKKKDEEGNTIEETRLCRIRDLNEQIRMLAKRMIEDYNDEQDRIEKRRKYMHVKLAIWGPSKPYTPTPHASTRASHEFALVGGRLEMEIRALLQASQRGEGESATDGSWSAHMGKAWENKMAAQEAAKRMSEMIGEKRVGLGLNGGILRMEASREENGVGGVLGAPVRKRRGTKKTKTSVRKTPKSKVVNVDSDEDEEEDFEVVRKTKATKESTKESTQKRKRVPANEDSEDEQVAVKKPARNRKVRTVMSEESDDVVVHKTPESPKHTEAEMSIFEELMDDITDAERNANKKPEEVAIEAGPKQIAKLPRNTVKAHTPTVEELEILQRMKQAEEGEVHSEEEEGEIIEEEEGEIIEEEEEGEEEKEDAAESEPASSKAVNKKDTPKQSDLKSPQNPTPPSKSPAPKSRSTKRKSPSSTSTHPPSRKSKYKSSTTITDSDDEADYSLPAAPALELPEQNEGWELTESLSTESVKVVQTGEATGGEMEEDVVVEQGTTIVKKVEGEKRKGPFVEEGYEDEEDEEDQTLVEEHEEEGRTLVEGIEEEMVAKRRTPFVESDDENEAHNSVEEIEMEKVEQRKTPFVESEDEEEYRDEDHKPVKKAKKVRFAEEVDEANEGERSMSVAIVLGEEKEDGEVQEHAEFDELFEE
jgi:hypothetical protein